MSAPRRHHFIPAGFLAGFTEEGGRDGTLWVYDIEKKSWRKSKPENEAHRRDFYTMESSSGDPFELEKMLGKDLEGPAINAICEIKETKVLPGKEGLEYLISFIGLLATRIPAHREWITVVHSSGSERIMDLVLSSKKMYENTLKNMKESGQEFDKNVTYEQMKEFFERGEYTFELNQDYLLTNMLKMATTITDLLYKRNWCLLIVDEGSEFICSENPVTLTWSEGTPKTFRSPGFGLRNTEVLVPISKEFALLGSFDDELPTVITLEPKGVAVLNRHTIILSNRFIYSSKPEFVFIKTDGNIGNSNDLTDIFGSE
jgi:hypothetical protein